MSRIDFDKNKINFKKEIIKLFIKKVGKIFLRLRKKIIERFFDF